jgi:hypothetical protein
MPSQVVGLIEIEGLVADFDDGLGIRRLGVLRPPAFSAEFIEADEVALKAELNLEYTRLLQRMRAK